MKIYDYFKREEKPPTRPSHVLHNSNSQNCISGIYNNDDFQYGRDSSADFGLAGRQSQANLDPRNINN